MSASRKDKDSAGLEILVGRRARSAWLRSALVLLVGAALSLVLFLALRRAESDSVALDFRRDASDRIAAFKVSLVHGLDTLVALDALYASTPDVDRSAFRAFTSEHLLEEPGVVLLGWAPRVEHSERTSFEQSVQSETPDDSDLAALVKGFRVFEAEASVAEEGRLRPEYTPVLYVEPPALGRHMLGFDLFSDPVQREALMQASDARSRSATQAFAYPPGTQDKFGVVVFSPVYGRTESTLSPDKGVGMLRGFVFGLFNVRAILDRALANFEPRGIDIAVYDLAAIRKESLIYYHESRLVQSDRRSGTIDEALSPVGLGMSDTVQVGDREWLVSCRPAIGYVAARKTSLPYLALVGGLLMAAALAGTVLAILGREAETRHYAQELLDAKQLLEGEAERREQARADLAASEERFRRAFGNTPIGAASVDLEGRFLQANPALCRMLQREESELLGMTIADVVHPDDVEEERAQLARLVNGEAESLQYVERLRRSDGDVIFAELNVSLVRDESGQPLYFVGQQQDVTDRRLSNQRLRQARETQERILDSLPLNVFLKDAEGTIRFINAQGLKFLGREREQVVGKTDYDIFSEDVADDLRRHDHLVLSTGESSTYEEQLELDGRTFHFLSGKTPIKVEGRDEPHLLGFSVDLTPIKEAEEALSRSEVRFRQLFENMSSGVSVYEAIDDGTDFVFRDYNRAAEKMDGISRAEVIGKRLTEVFPGSEEMGLLALLQKVWTTSEPQDLPVAFYEDARFQGWRENYAYRLPSGEIVAICNDISERKRLEVDLLHAQKMEAIGRLAGGVAHDFNNLLQVVAGNCELLLSGTFDSSGVEKMLEEIHQQADRGTQLVRRLLVFSRRESYAPTGMDLGEVLRGAETLVRRLLRENIDLVVELAEGPLPVEGDRGQLEQVLMNLVVNASDAMPEGGTLEIRSGEVAGEIWFSIADTGPGIAEEMQDRVFDPYFTTKSAAQGTGLGLAVVDGIVSVHGGRIVLDNRPGKGVEFRIFLPRIEERKRALEPEEVEEVSLRSKGDRVLVVEDQDLVRGTIQSMLTSLGYRVWAAADGAGAREYAAAQEFELLVSDIVLPDTTGVELAQDFRAARPRLAVLLVSGYAEEAVRERGAEFRFLQKPFRLEDLAQKAADALRARRSEEE